MLEIIAYGTPGPQGSKRFVGVKGGRGVMIESSKSVKPWREAVKWAAVEACGVALPESAAPVVCGAIAVEMIFTLSKPKGAPKGRQTWPDRKPDLSKLVRSTEDALTDAGAWEDDARIVSCLARKVFPNEDPDALQSPGAVIRIWRINARRSRDGEVEPTR